MVRGHRSVEKDKVAKLQQKHEAMLKDALAERASVRLYHTLNRLLGLYNAVSITCCADQEMVR